MSSSLFASAAEIVRHASATNFWVAALSLAFAASVCCFFWVRALYRARLIADMPTAKLRSAAQGYVELEGWVRAMPGEPVYAPLSGKPCVWYRYEVAQTGRGVRGDPDDWNTVESGVSEAIFHLDDSTGVCIVDPDGAEVTPAVKLCWRGDSARPLYTPKTTSAWSLLFSAGRYRYTECRLHDGDPVYAIGQFSGAGEQEAVGIKEATRDLLAVWKRDRALMLQRFDHDRDGQINLQEWEDARLAAEREVIATWSERQQQPETKLLKKPSHGRPYILSSVPQSQLIAGYRRQTLFGGLGFAACGLALAWALLQRFG